MKKEPFCYIAIDGDEFNGVIDPNIDRKSLAEFLVEMIEYGSTIKPLYSRSEYDAEMDRINKARKVTNTQD